MFTRNFMKICIFRTIGVYANSTSEKTSKGDAVKVINTTNSGSFFNTLGTTDFKYLTTTNTEYLNFDTSSTTSIASNSKSPARFHIVFGKGTTQPTIDDFQLEDIISANDLRTLSQAFNLDKYFYDNIFELSRLIQNTTDQDITVNEIGISAVTGIPTSTSAQNEPWMLLWREVLDQPITIPAGRTRSITIGLDFNKLNG